MIDAGLEPDRRWMEHHRRAQVRRQRARPGVGEEHRQGLAQEMRANGIGVKGLNLKRVAFMILVN